MNKPNLACIIDDDPMFTYIMSKQMREINFSSSLLTFKNGLEAVNYIRLALQFPENIPDIILLDLNMPVMDGWQFLDEFRNFVFEKEITVYIISSSISKQDHDKAKTYENVSNFYVKPISKDHLRNMLSDFN